MDQGCYQGRYFEKCFEIQDIVFNIENITKYVGYKDVVKVGRFLKLDQVFPEGDLGQVGNGRHVQLLHDIIFVRFHGLRTDTESL
jgi:hypothetical protein